MAATALTANLSAAFNWIYDDALSLSTPRDAATQSWTDSLTFGTGAQQANIMYHTQATLANGGSTSVDLAGSLTDAFNNTVVFTVVKAIMFRNLGVASGSTFLETSGENAILSTSTCTATDVTAPIEPGGVYIHTSPVAGVTIGAGSTDLITITRAGSATITYRLIVIGLS